jgi:hypothetical protein
MRFFSRAFALVALVWSALVAAPALAEPPDTEALLTRLDAMLGESGYVAEFGPVESAGPGEFRIAHVNMTGRGLSDPARVEEVIVGGADVAADGSLWIERLSFASLVQSGRNKRGRDYAVRVEGGEVSGLYLPDSQDTAVNLVPERGSAWKIGRMTMTVDGAVAILIDGVSGSSVPDAARETLASTAEVARLRIDPYAAGEPDLARRASELEMLTLDLSFRLAANWNAVTGRMEVDTWRVEAPGLGVLDFNLVLDGYTGERVRQMRSANAATSGNSGDGAQAMRAAGMEIMSALGGISVVGATLRFEDRSLVRRSLEARARDEGTTVEDLARILPDMSLSYTQMLDMPEFSQKLADALRAFLSDPKSMTIRLKPASPAPVAGLVGVALFSPATLVQQLGIEVTANE